MTDPADLEWDYRYNERLGILTQGEKPTPEQVKIAEDEASAIVAILFPS